MRFPFSSGDVTSSLREMSTSESYALAFYECGKATTWLCDRRVVKLR